MPVTQLRKRFKRQHSVTHESKEGAQETSQIIDEAVGEATQRRSFCDLEAVTSDGARTLGDTFLALVTGSNMHGTGLATLVGGAPEDSWVRVRACGTHAGHAAHTDSMRLPPAGHTPFQPLWQLRSGVSPGGEAGAQLRWTCMWTATQSPPCLGQKAGSDHPCGHPKRPPHLPLPHNMPPSRAHSIPDGFTGQFPRT